MIVEKYDVAEKLEKRRCEDCDYRLHGPEHDAEFIFNNGTGDKFLCRVHLAQNLVLNPAVLARYVIDLQFN